MKCHNCGKEIPDGALACFACNTNVPSDKMKNKKSQGKTSGAKQIQPRQANSQKARQTNKQNANQHNQRQGTSQKPRQQTGRQSISKTKQQSRRPANQQTKRSTNQQSKRPTKQQQEMMEAADNRKKAITIGIIATIVLLIALGIFIYYFVNYSSYSIDGSYAAIEDSSRCIIKIKNNKGTLKIYENDELVRNEDITIQKQDNTTFTINKNNNRLLLYDADTNTLTLKENGEVVYVLEQLNN